MLFQAWQRTGQHNAMGSLRRFVFGWFARCGGRHHGWEARAILLCLVPPFGSLFAGSGCASALIFGLGGFAALFDSAHSRAVVASSCPIRIRRIYGDVPYKVNELGSVDAILAGRVVRFRMRIGFLRWRSSPAGVRSRSEQVDRQCRTLNSTHYAAAKRTPPPYRPATACLAGFCRKPPHEQPESDMLVDRATEVTWTHSSKDKLGGSRDAKQH